MRFTIIREPFLKGLLVASKAIGSKSPIPVMSNVKLDLSNKGLTITGSNAELTIETIIPFKQGDKELIRDVTMGATLIANKYITEITRRLEGEELTIEVIDNTIVKVSDGKSDFTLNSIKVDEYPDVDMKTNGIDVVVGGEEFKTLVDQTAFAASNKDQRPILTALNLEIREGELNATATDSARLARKTLKISGTSVITANIPASVVIEVSRLIENNTSVQIAIDEKKAVFIIDNTVVSSRLINGEYPNTKNIVPRGFSYYLEANAQELISAMERVSLLSVERENVIKLTVSDEGVEVSAKSSQIGSAVEKINAYQYTGERLEISFNAMYVMQAIRAIRSEEVTLAFLGEMKPFVIKNVKDDSLVQLVTPVRTY